MPDLGTLTRRDGHWDGTSSRFDAQVPATRPKRGGGKPCGDSFWAREGERGTDAGSVQFASIGLVHSPRSPRTGSQSPLRSEAALSQTRSPASLSRARGRRLLLRSLPGVKEQMRSSSQSRLTPPSSHSSPPPPDASPPCTPVPLSHPISPTGPTPTTTTPRPRTRPAAPTPSPSPPSPRRSPTVPRKNTCRRSTRFLPPPTTRSRSTVSRTSTLRRDPPSHSRTTPRPSPRASSRTTTPGPSPRPSLPMCSLPRTPPRLRPSPPRQAPSTLACPSHSLPPSSRRLFHTTLTLRVIPIKDVL